MANIVELLNLARTIRYEKGAKQNTALRVGGLMLDIINVIGSLTGLKESSFGGFSVDSTEQDAINAIATKYTADGHVAPELCWYLVGTNMATLKAYRYNGSGSPALISSNEYDYTDFSGVSTRLLQFGNSLAQLTQEVNKTLNGSTKNYKEGWVLNYSSSTKGTPGTSATGAIVGDNFYIPVNGGDTIEWYSGASADYADRAKLSLVVYDSSKQIVAAYNTSANNGWTVKTVTLPSNIQAAYVRGSFVLAEISSCYIKVNGVVAWKAAEDSVGHDSRIASLESEIVELGAGMDDFENAVNESVAEVERESTEKIYGVAGMLDGNIQQYLTIEAGGISSGKNQSNTKSIRTKGFIESPTIKVTLGTGKRMLIVGYNSDGTFKQNGNWRTTGGEFSFADKYRIVYRTNPETNISPSDFPSFNSKVTVYNASAKKALIPNDVVNNLVSGGTKVPLSAEQGVVLKGDIDLMKGPGSTTSLSNLINIASFLAGYTTADSLQALLSAISNREISWADCSAALQQMILSGGGGEVVNNPDDEDLTVVGGLLKLKNKSYDATAHSGLGRVFLRKNMVDGDNIISSSMFPTANTIYVVQYAYTFGVSEPSITLPSNCVLLFLGGSFRGGSLELDNTTIMGTDDGFVNMVVTGTVKNDKVESRWFYKGSDFAQEWINLVTIANDSKRDIVFKKDRYTIGDGIMSGSSATPVVKCEMSVDFGGSEIELAPTNEHLFLAFQNSEAEDLGVSDTSLITEINSKPKSVKFSSLKDCCLLITDTAHEEIQRQSSNTPYYRKEYVYIDKDGYRQNDYFGDSITPTSIRKIDCSRSSKVSNVRVILRDGFTGTQSSNYRFVGFRFYASSNLTFENIQMDINCQEYKLNYVYGENGYNVRFVHFYSRNTADAIEVSGASVSSSYVFHFYHIIKLTMEDVKVSGLTNGGWGATGTNYITDWTIRDCELNRVDNHIRLNNLYISNSIIGNKGIHYTGWGEIIVEDTTFIGCSYALQPREDYASFFDGNITLRNCRFINVGAVAGVQFYSSDFGLQFHADAVICRKLTIDGLRAEGTTSGFSILKVISGEPLSAKILPYVIARNIESENLALCNRGWGEANVLGSNELRFDIGDSDLMNNNLFSSSSGSDDKTIKVRLTNCDNVKMGASGPATIHVIGSVITDMTADDNDYYVHGSRLVFDENSAVGSGQINLIGCVLDIAQGLSTAQKTAVSTFYNEDLQGSNIDLESCVNTAELDEAL